MMIRSTPPASAHLAESPVPAPAPMIGAARVDLGAQPRERLVARHRRAPGSSSCSRSAIASAKAGSLTSSVELVHLDVAPTVSRSAAEQRLVRRGVVEGAGPRRRSSRRPAAGGRARSGRSRAASFSADPAAELGALLRRRPHQRDRRVVDVEVAVARTARRTRLARAEVDHVERAERDDLRDARARPPPRAGPGRRRGRRRRARRRARSS